MEKTHLLILRGQAAFSPARLERMMRAAQPALLPVNGPRENSIRPAKFVFSPVSAYVQPGLPLELV